jgi:26S proteasome regulatory subunit N11
VMDAFRSIHPHSMMMNSEPRITTSNVGCLYKPAREAKMRGLNKLFYSIITSSRKSDTLEIEMLQNLNKKPWHSGFTTEDYAKD